MAIADILVAAKESNCDVVGVQFENGDLMTLSLNNLYGEEDTE
jgi:hypothetical protein